MDPLSQAALGALVGQAAGQRMLGYRAAAVGAAAGAIPDIDVLFSLNGDYFEQLVTHRGITHSLFFAPVVGPAIGWLVWRWERGRDSAYKRSSGRRLRCWMVVATLALLSHPLLDYLTPYGTQLLLPFSDTRFAASAMPIIDPVYTVILLAGLVLAARQRAAVVRVATVTLAMSSAYLGYGWALNMAAEKYARDQLARDGIRDAHVAAFPTILQLHYRRVVARTEDTDRVGFISMWEPCEIDWQSAPRTDRRRIAGFLDTREGAIFHWVTMGWAHYRLIADPNGRSLVATDLRYGFSSEPGFSFFAAVAPVDANDRPTGPVLGGRFTAPPQQNLTAATAISMFGRVLDAAYEPACGPDLGGPLTADAAIPI